MTLSRRRTELRPVTLEPFVTAAPGSVLITQGGTRVLCTASIARDTPAWLIDPATGQAARGWVTAEYAMLPGSTRDRKRRGADGRSTEIQRFIGRALRAAVDLTKMPGVTITCDCDVLCADGGTRTAAITGAFVALAQAIQAARKEGLIQRDPIHGPVAAVSVGLVDSRLHLDLDYALDARAQVDMNVVMNHRGRFIEVQGAGEQGTFSHQELQAMLKLAGQGVRKLMRLQRQVLRGALRP